MSKKRITNADLENQAKDLRSKLSAVKKELKIEQDENMDFRNKIYVIEAKSNENFQALTEKTKMLADLEEKIRAIGQLTKTELKVFKACVLNILFGEQLIGNLNIQKKKSNIIFNGFGTQKIHCIKALREASKKLFGEDGRFGLKLAKEISESGPGKVIFDNLSDDQVKMVLDIFEQYRSDAELVVE